MPGTRLANLLPDLAGEVGPVISKQSRVTATLNIMVTSLAFSTAAASSNEMRRLRRM